MLNIKNDFFPLFPIFRTYVNKMFKTIELQKGNVMTFWFITFFILKLLLKKAASFSPTYVGTYTRGKSRLCITEIRAYCPLFRHWRKLYASNTL